MSDGTQALPARQSVRPACAGVSPEIMFPTKPNGRPKGGDKSRHYRAALALCDVCDYHHDCRRIWEELGRPLDGVWFGTTPPERVGTRIARRDLSGEIGAFLARNGTSTGPEILRGIGDNTTMNSVYVALRYLREQGRAVKHDTTPATFSSTREAH